MRINTNLLVLSVLLGSGFLGGFCVSKGSGHYLGVMPVHSAHRQGGGRNYGAEGAAGIMAAGGGGSSETVRMAAGGEGGNGADEGVQGGAEAGGAGGGAEAGGGQDGAGEGGMMRTVGGGAGAAGSGSAEGDRARALATAPGVSTSSGADAIEILSGNSLKRDNPDGTPRYTYFAPRGWQADGDEHGFVVRTWDRNSGQFCETRPKSAKQEGLACTALEIRYASAKEQPAGAMIGVMRTGGDDWAFIIKGNAAHFPDHIPSLDSTLEARAPAGPNARLTASGKAAWSAMLGQTFGTGTTPANRRIVQFAREGRVLQVEAHDEAATAAEGVRIAVGHWTFDKGLLCQGDGTPAAPRACYRPEAYGPTSFRLVLKSPAAAEATAATTLQHLSLLSEQKSAFKATQN